MTLLKDPNTEALIRKYGFWKVPLLTTNEIAELNAVTKKLTSSISIKKTKTFYALGNEAQIEIRDASIEIVRKHFVPPLAQLFLEDKVDIFPGVHLIKPSGLKNYVEIHQDCSHVDESKFLCISAWMPLQDTYWWNGCFQAIPGSQLLGNPQRGHSIPYPFKNNKELKKLLIQIPAKKGEVILFDRAILHGSSNNLSLKKRIAVISLIKPKEAAFIHYYMDKTTPIGKVGAYEVSYSFLKEHDILKKPPEEFPFIGYEDLKIPTINPEELKRITKDYLNTLYDN